MHGGSHAGGKTPVAPTEIPEQGLTGCCCNLTQQSKLLSVSLKSNL